MGLDSVVWGGVRVTLTEGDITAQEVDAVVNAANSMLHPGSGVDGAIQRAAGPALLVEREEARRRLGRWLPTGSAVSTGAGNMKVRRIIHTVGPVWSGGRAGEAELLASCYQSALRVAKEEGLATVAFPSISTGVYGYPVEEAARVALRAVKEELEQEPGSLREVRFVLYGAPTFEVFRQALAELASKGE